MKKRTERILAVIGALCLLFCLAPTFQAAEPDGTDDMTALRSLYEAGLELERDGFRVLEGNQISIREVPAEATDLTDLLVVKIIPDKTLGAHSVDLILQMFIRGDKVCTLRQEILLIPGETMELAFFASGEDIPASCFRVFLMDRDDERLSPPDQCYGSVMLKVTAGSSPSLEFQGTYIPQETEEETTSASPTIIPTETTAPTQPQESTEPTTETTECPPLPDIELGDSDNFPEIPTLPPSPSPSQPGSTDADNNIGDEWADFDE